MKSQLIVLLVAALLASASGASLAQNAPVPPQPPASGAGASKVRDACLADVMTICPDVRDRDGFRQCLRSHYADMSDGCKSAIAAMRSQAQSSGVGR